MQEQKEHGMETQKLRVKIGVHEFEAEGPAEVVRAQFEEWKNLIGSVPEPPPPAQDKPREGGGEIGDTDTDESVLFEVNRDKGIVSLTAQPDSERRDSDAALLVLYGYRIALAEEEVLVGRIKESLAESGITPGRMDRTLEPHRRGGFVLKRGQGKGGKYRLSNTGVQRAAEMTREMVERMV